MQAKTGLLHRPVWLLTGGIALLLRLAFGLLLYSAWRHDRELAPLQYHLDHIAAIESADQLLRGAADKAARGTPDASSLAYTGAWLHQLQESTAGLDPRSAELIGAARLHFADFEREPLPSSPALRDARLLIRRCWSANSMRRSLLVENAPPPAANNISRSACSPDCSWY